MRHDSRAYLWDVCHAADVILDVVAGIDLNTYAGSEVIHSTVERKFQIIGEALNRFSKAAPTLAASIPARRARRRPRLESAMSLLKVPHPVCTIVV
ncbi:MAG: hypothetical protein EXR29_04210 [Betaproteobacteria bacterium]|nr:hypothetical protein [Betaproteobacteria bacterium]